MDFATISLLLITIVGWGLWGFLQKVGVLRMGVESCLFLNYSTVFLVILSYLAFTHKFQVSISESAIYPIIGGVSTAIGSIAFFTLLERVPVSLVRPIAGLSVLITALLGLLLLGEALTIKQYVGVGLAIAAIILLSS